MTMFWKASLLCCLAFSMLAQEPQKNIFSAAPPEIEKALRERVSAFYQCYLDGTFRKADNYVAEDTKDRFYAQEKQKFRNYEIVRIDFDDSMQKAKVVTTVGTVVRARGQNFNVEAPFATSWKLENGLWHYFIPVDGGKETPFGRMKAGPDSASGGGSASPAPDIGEIVNNPELILKKIHLSKQQVNLKSTGASTDTLKVNNSFIGPVVIVVQSQSLPGLTWKIDQPNLKHGETAAITFTHTPKGSAPIPTAGQIVQIRIDPFGQTLSVPIILGQ